MKILVAKMSSLGDLFHPLPAVHCLKMGLRADIHWVANEEYAELVSTFTDVDRVIAFPRRHFMSGAARFLGELRRERYDMLVDFQGLLKSAMVLRAARGGLRIGPSFSREGARFLYDKVAGRVNKERHAVEENMDVVRMLGLPLLDACFPIALPPPVLSDAAPRVGLVVASRWPTKNWPEEYFGAVAAGLKKLCGATVYVIGGAGDAGVAARVIEAARVPVVDLTGRLTLVQMAGVLAELDLLIANDSGPVHAAAAVGTQALVLFGPTDPMRTGPYGDRHRMLTSGDDCSPCFSRSCMRGDIRCMKSIAPDRVIEAAAQMISARRDRPVEVTQSPA
ncbi:MAG: glycosyltransferase family 9 protein [Lentisphaerae bacterium]|nr:glycosyltransferase family 9 protein [Lentisphaerota bacterium]